MADAAVVAADVAAITTEAALGAETVAMEAAHLLVWVPGRDPGDACSTENRQHDPGEEIAFEASASRLPYDR